jgi:hypothetical protein
MTLNWKHKTFNLTYTKMKYWHEKAGHHGKKVGCPFCEGDMYKIAEVLKDNGLEILDVGHAWVKIRAEKNYKPFHGGMTDESNLLYQIVSGQVEKKQELDEIEKAVKKEREQLICPEYGGELKAVKYRILMPEKKLS